MDLQGLKRVETALLGLGSLKMLQVVEICRKIENFQGPQRFGSGSKPTSGTYSGDAFGFSLGDFCRGFRPTAIRCFSFFFGGKTLLFLSHHSSHFPAGKTGLLHVTCCKKPRNIMQLGEQLYRKIRKLFSILLCFYCMFQGLKKPKGFLLCIGNTVSTT